MSKQDDELDDLTLITMHDIQKIITQVYLEHGISPSITQDIIISVVKVCTDNAKEDTNFSQVSHRRDPIKKPRS